MVGSGGMLIGLGHDIQLLSELKSIESLKIPGFFFTERESRYFQESKNAIQSMTACFAAKEAFFKALPHSIPSFYWTDVEVLHDRHRAPYFQFHNSLEAHLHDHRWLVHLSISHSGEYVSTVVVISQLPQDNYPKN